MSKHYKALILVCLTNIYAFSHRMSVVPFYDLYMQKYEISYAQAGALLSVFFAGYALCLIPAGLLADRREARGMLVTGLVIVGFSATLFSLANSYGLSLILRFTLGIGTALIHPAAIKILAANFPPRMLGFAVGLREAAVGIGILLAVSVVPLLSAWWHPFSILLVIAFLWVPLVAAFYWIRPSSANCGPRGDTFDYDSFGSVLFNKNVLLLLGVSFFGMFTVNGFLGWFPTFLEDGLNFDKGTAGTIMSAYMLVMITVSLFSGRISDLIGKRKPVLAAGSGIIALVLLLLIFQSNISPFILAVMAGLATALAMPPMLTMAAEVAEAKNSGLVTGIVTTIGQISSSLSGFSLGWIIDFTGRFNGIWITMLALLLIQFVFILFIKDRSQISLAEKLTGKSNLG